MRTTAITCAVLAASLGFSSLASARDWNDRRDERQEQREARRDLREYRQDLREARRDHRQDVREARRDYRQDRRDDWRRDQRAWQHAPRYYRGGYVPRQYQQPYYYVDNWRARPGLYAPPHGHRWVQTDTGEVLLMAVATGLIVNLLMNQ